MNQNTPNLGLALWWPNPCSLPIEWGSRDFPPNVNLRPRVVLDIQVWLPAREGVGRSHSSSEGIMLISRGERMTKTLEGTEAEQQTPDILRAGETRGNKLRCSLLFSVALRDPPCLGGWPLIKINFLHNNIVDIQNDWLLTYFLPKFDLYNRISTRRSLRQKKINSIIRTNLLKMPK